MGETYLIIDSNGRARKTSVSYTSFPDGDTHCLIEDIEDLRRNPVLVVHYLYPNQNEQLVRLILLMDLLKDLGARSVDIFCPYLPYSRQDKRHLPGEALGAQMICRLLAASGAHNLYTLDCHFMRGKATMLYEGLQIRNIPGSERLLDVCKKHIGGKPFHVIGPDGGSRFLTKQIGRNNMHKKRGNYASSSAVRQRHITELSATHLSFSCSTVVVVDDIVSTGGTMLRAIHQLRDRRIANIYCVATHGLFIGDCYDQISELTSGIVTSDSTPSENAVPLVADILSEVVLPHWSSGHSNQP